MQQYPCVFSSIQVSMFGALKNQDKDVSRFHKLGYDIWYNLRKHCKLLIITKR